MWIPKVSYGPPTTAFAFTLPMFMHRPISVGVGGGDETMSGIGYAIEIRRDQIAEIRLRFYESEWNAVQTYFAWLQKFRHLTHQFWFDKSSDTTMRTVNLHSPHLGAGGFEPDRNAQYLGAFEFAFSIRTANGQPFNLNWSGD